MPSARNDTNAFWRVVHAEASVSRDGQEAVFTARLAEHIASGRIGGRELGPGHWRIWHPSRPAESVDYWPRTGTLVRHNRRLPESGLQRALRILKA
jgi:hypothetical protein